MRNGSGAARRRTRLRAVFQVLLVGALVLVVLVGGLVVWSTGRDIYAPVWMRTQIETRLAQSMPSTTVAFGDIVMILDEGWRPRVRVRDVRVADSAGAEIVTFSEVRASLAMQPLFSGALELKSLDLSGVIVTLRRSRDGRIALSSGAGSGGVAREASNLAQLITELDDVLLLPVLSSLNRVGLRALTLRYEDERAGRAWTADGGRLRMTRDGSDVNFAADLAVLSGGAQAATLEANYTGKIGSSAADFGIKFADVLAADIAEQSPAFAWLGALQAPISGSLRSGVDEGGKISPLSATLQIGAGVIRPNLETQPIPIDGARSYFSYLPEDQKLRFDELSVSSKWGTARLEGEATLTGVDAGALTDLVGQFRLSDITINPSNLYHEPVSIEGAELDFRLKPKPFRLELARLQIADQGQTLTVNGSLNAEPTGWAVRVDAMMEAITPERLLALWPERVAGKTRSWLSQNLIRGALANTVFALRWEPGALPQTYLGFEFDDTDVRFLPNMPPIEQARGHVSLLAKRFVLSVDKGHVTAPEGGQLDIASSAFIIPDVTIRDGTPVVVRLASKSSVTAALSILNRPPLSVMDKANLPVDIATGQADLQATIAFSMVPKGEKAQLEYTAAGQLNGVKTERLVPSRKLEAAALRVVASNREVRISGQGTLDGVPFDVAWAQTLGPDATGSSRLQGQIELSNSALSAFGVSLPPGSVSGQGTANIQVELPKGEPPAFDLSSDLRGVTLNAPPLSWTKLAQTPGNLRVSGTLGPVPRVEKLEVSGPGLSASGSVALSEARALDRVKLNRLTVGDWLDVPVDLVGRGAGVNVGVEVRGGSLDLRRSQFGPSGSSSASTPITLALDRVRITDTIELNNMQGQFTTSEGLDGAFTGRVNGETPVSGRIVPMDGRSGLRITSDDAGGVFASAGVLRQARGGALDLTLRPVGTGGAFDGTLRVSQISIRDAPVMAALLNAVSIVGLLDELGGTGIFFSEVEGKFRLSPGQITLTEGSAVGPSMGISMDGVFATDTGALSLQGVISPVYLLNGIASFLTRRGEGLIGFNYAVSGLASAPEVSVNALSALAPGMFRNLLRPPPPQAPVVEGEVLPPEPDPSANTSVPLVDGTVGR
jgi:hypothetical protein